MRKRLFNQQSEPRSREAQKTWRLSVKAKIMMALLALMLIPQGMWAQGAMPTGTLRIGGDSDLSGYGGAVSYDETTNTLSLNGATVLDAIENDHTSISTLTVVFSGTNTINTSSGSLGPCISGSGSIVFKASSPDADPRLLLCICKELLFASVTWVPPIQRL